MVVKNSKMTQYRKTFNSVFNWAFKHVMTNKTIAKGQTLQHSWVSSQIPSEQDTDTDYVEDFGIFNGSDDKASSYHRLYEPISLYLNKTFLVKLFSALRLEGKLWNKFASSHYTDSKVSPYLTFHEKAKLTILLHLTKTWHKTKKDNTK